jgi:hypothetical protein
MTLHILNELEAVYAIAGTRGVCGLISQYKHEDRRTIDYQIYKEYSRPTATAINCISVLNELYAHVPERIRTPLQYARMINNTIKNKMIWPIDQKLEHEFLRESTIYSLGLVMERFYSEQSRLGDRARFGSTTLSVLQDLRTSLQMVTETKLIVDRLTAYMVVTKLSR